MKIQIPGNLLALIEGTDIAEHYTIYHDAEKNVTTLEGLSADLRQLANELRDHAAKREGEASDTDRKRPKTNRIVIGGPEDAEAAKITKLRSTARQLRDSAKKIDAKMPPKHS